jgi:hypothetical protein
MTNLEELVALLQMLNILPAAISILVAFAVVNNIPSKISNRFKRNRIRNRGYGLTEMDAIDDVQFRRMFRMSRRAFNILLSKLNVFILEKDAMSIKQAINSSGSPIDNKTKLAVTLRFLAGGSYLDITFAFGISKTSFYDIVFEVLEAIDKIFQIGISSWCHGEAMGWILGKIHLIFT